MENCVFVLLDCLSLSPVRRSFACRSLENEETLWSGTLSWKPSKRPYVFDTISYQHMSRPLYTAELKVMFAFISRKRQAQSTGQRAITILPLYNWQRHVGTTRTSQISRRQILLPRMGTLGQNIPHTRNDQGSCHWQL